MSTKPTIDEFDKLHRLVYDPKIKEYRACFRIENGKIIWPYSYIYTRNEVEVAVEKDVALQKKTCRIMDKRIMNLLVPSELGTGFFVARDIIQTKRYWSTFPDRFRVVMKDYVRIGEQITEWYEAEPFYRDEWPDHACFLRVKGFNTFNWLTPSSTVVSPDQQDLHRAVATVVYNSEIKEEEIKGCYDTLLEKPPKYPTASQMNDHMNPGWKSTCVGTIVDEHSVVTYTTLSASPGASGSPVFLLNDTSRTFIGTICGCKNELPYAAVTCVTDSKYTSFYEKRVAPETQMAY